MACLHVQKVLDGLDWSEHFPNLRWKARQALQALTDNWQAALRWFMLTCEARHAVRVRDKQLESVPWGADAWHSTGSI